MLLLNSEGQGELQDVKFKERSYKALVIFLLVKDNVRNAPRKRRVTRSSLDASQGLEREQSDSKVILLVLGQILLSHMNILRKHYS